MINDMVLSTAHSIERTRSNGTTNDRLVACATLALWVGTATVTAAELGLGYRSTNLPDRPKPPLRVEQIRVDLKTESTPPAATPPATPATFAPASPRPTSISPPQQPSVETPPAMATVATPSKALLPTVPTVPPMAAVEKATSPVPVAVSPSTGRSTGVQPADAPQQLVFGVGDGRQPQPTYPRDAIAGKQEGRAVVRFKVGEDGRVNEAAVVEPCKWPLLNRAAERAVRERWTFAAGGKRVYDVAISFTLQKN